MPPQIRDRLALVNGKPRFVTALGESDAAQGWRERKADGGVVIDLATNQVLKRGLSMLHSPRVYKGKLWFLESGNGSLATMDLDTGEVTTVAELPGFTRGLSFLGPFAFIGLSQVRESAIFSGIPITKRLKERTCGVWVVRIDTGETVAFVKFEEAVQEIFAVEVLPGVRDDDLIATTYVLPNEALADVAPAASKPS